MRTIARLEKGESKMRDLTAEFHKKQIEGVDWQTAAVDLELFETGEYTGGCAASIEDCWIAFQLNIDTSAPLDVASAPQQTIRRCDNR